MTKARLAALIAGAAIFAMGSAGTASAVPVYGYAYLDITNFQVSITGGGIPTPIANNTSVSGQTSAQYDVLSDTHNNVGNITTGVNTQQSTAGPGPFPLDNTFSPSLLASAGARADMNISGPLLGGAHSQTLSEGNLLLFNSTASSQAGSLTTVKIVFTAASNNVTLTFDGRAVLDAVVGSPGDFASAQTSVSGTLRGPAGFVNINDNTGNGDGGTKVSPALLNVSLSTIDPLSPAHYDETGRFSFTASNLTTGASYTLTLNDQTQIFLASAAAVPEPASLALVGSGLLGLVFLRQRRQRKQNSVA